MSLTVDSMTPADIRACTCGNDNNSNGMWGGDWLGYLLLFALLGGGLGGFGGFGGGGILPWLLFGNGGFGNGNGSFNLATDFATIERKIDGVNNGLCDGFYAQNTNMLNGFAGVQQTLCQGFSGVDRSIANLGYQLAQCCCDTKSAIKDVNTGIERTGWSLSKQISDCCCDTRAAIADVKYANERNTCDIIRASQDNTRAILDYLSNEKISALQAENAGLKAQISNDRQSAYIVDALTPKCPQPAYVVQPPQQVTFPTNCCGGVNYAAFNNGCGCN